MEPPTTHPGQSSRWHHSLRADTPDLAAVAGNDSTPTHAGLASSWYLVLAAHADTHRRECEYAELRFNEERHKKVGQTGVIRCRAQGNMYQPVLFYMQTFLLFPFQLFPPLCSSCSSFPHTVAVLCSFLLPSSIGTV